MYVVLSSRSENLANTVEMCNLCRVVCQPVDPIFLERGEETGLPLSIVGYPLSDTSNQPSLGTSNIPVHSTPFKH